MRYDKGLHLIEKRQRLMASPKLVLDDLACRRGGRILFAGVDLSLSAGQAALIVGRNGSGKSSLLRMVAGLIQPFAGRILWLNENVRREPDAFQASMRYVGHADGLQAALTVSENLAYWTRLCNAPSDRSTLANALSAVGLDELADLPARYLSAGQRRRLALARPIACSPNAEGLWLLDEPTVALDRSSVILIDAAIAKFRAYGGIVIASTNAPLELPDAILLDVSEFTPEEVTV
jgi:heme exporter protein A